MFPVFFGTDAHDPFECPVEMGDIVKPYPVANVGDGGTLLRSVQHLAGQVDPVLFQVGEKGLARVFPEECAEGEAVHIDLLGDILQLNFLAGMVYDV